jgi:hypothetical protein
MTFLWSGDSWTMFPELISVTTSFNVNAKLAFVYERVSSVVDPDIQ